jgi:uncharacterized protein (TIGR03437 family)
MGRVLSLLVVTAGLGYGAITVAPAGLSFPNGGALTPQTITVTNTAGTTYNVSAVAAAPGGQAWLTVSPAGDTTASTLSVSVNTSGLAPGTYPGSVQLQVNNLLVAFVSVTLTVPSGGPSPITLSPSPVAANFAGAVGGANPAPVTFDVNSAGNTAFSLSSNASWLSVTVADGFSKITPSRIVITPTLAGLSGNSVYSDTVKITTLQGLTLATVPVTLTMTGSPAIVPGNYAIQTFDVPGASNTTIRGIDSFAIVSGEYVQGGKTFGFLRSPDGDFGTLQYPGAIDTHVRGINDVGQVAGFYTDTGGTHGYLLNFDGVTYTGFDYPGAEGSTRGLGIDSFGGVTGATNTLGFFRNYDGSNMAPFLVGTISPTGFNDASFGLNDLGQIAGTLAGTNQGFIQQPDGSAVAYQVGDGVFGTTAIDVAGTVAGYVTTNGQTHGYVRTADGTKFLTLDVPGADAATGTRIYGINNAGQVAGFYGDAGHALHGFMATPQSGVLSITPAAISVTAHLNGPAVSQLAIASGTAPIAFKIDTSNFPSWLEVIPPQSATPAFLTFTVKPDGLAIGTYTAQVPFMPTSGGAPPVTIPVTLNVTMPLPPVVQLSPQFMRFTYVAGGAAPDSQTLTVKADSAGVLNSVKVTYGQGPSGWLVLPSTKIGGDLPQTVEIKVNPVLPVGQYAASITANVPNADVASALEMGVLLTVTAQPTGGGTTPPTVTPQPTLIALGATSGGAPVSQSIAVTTSTGAAFTADVATSDGGKWLTMAVVNSASPGSVTVTANPAGLNPGSYSGTVSLASGIATAQVPVTFTVNPVPLVVAPAALALTAPAGYGVTGYAPLQVSAAIAMPFNVAVDDGGARWLQIDANTGTTPGVVNVRANTASLSPGTYSGTLTLSEGAIPVGTIPVTLTVGPPALLRLSPGSLAFSYLAGDAVPPAQTVKVESVGSAAQTFAVAVAPGASWLSAKGGGTTSGTVQVSANAAGLPGGVYQGSVTITPGASGASVQQIPVTLTVSAPATPVVTSILNAASSMAGPVAPGEMVAITGAGLGPKPGVTGSIANGSLPFSLGGTVVTFDGTPAPLLYASDGVVVVQEPYGSPRGVDNLVVSYRGVASQAKVVPQTASAPGLYTADATGKGAAAALNQDLTPNSAMNAAARGSVIVLYATGEGSITPALDEGKAVAFDPPYPAPVLPVLVTIGGLPANVLFTGETPGAAVGLLQVNAIVPAGVTPGAAVPVVVTVGTAASQPGVTVAVK